MKIEVSVQLTVAEVLDRISGEVDRETVLKLLSEFKKYKLLNKNGLALAKHVTPAALQVKSNRVVAHYCDEYRAKYMHSPKITPKRAGILKRLAEDHGIEGSCRLISGFIQLPDASLVKAAHPIEWLEQRLNEVTRFIETGKVVFREQAREADKEASLKQKHAALDRDYESRVGAVFAEDQAALPEAKREPLKGS